MDINSEEFKEKRKEYLNKVESAIKSANFPYEVLDLPFYGKIFSFSLNGQQYVTNTVDRFGRAELYKLTEGNVMCRVKGTIGMSEDPTNLPPLSEAQLLILRKALKQKLKFYWDFSASKAYLVDEEGLGRYSINRNIPEETWLRLKPYLIKDSSKDFSYTIYSINLGIDFEPKKEIKYID